MRMKLRIPAVAAVTLGMGLMSGVAPVANAAPDEDACAMVTPAQWSSALGVKMGEGKHVTETFTRTCTWNTAGPPTGGIKFVTLYLQKASEYDGGKNMAKMMGQGKMKFEAASGVGDDAYFLSTDNDKITQLLAKKGSGAFKIAIYGDMATDKKKAAAKEIAGEVVGKM